MWKHDSGFGLLEDGGHELSISRNLATISDEGIKLLGSRVHLYLEHYRIISKKRKNEESKHKLISLKTLHKIIDEEIQFRKRLVSEG